MFDLQPVPARLVARDLFFEQLGIWRRGVRRERTLIEARQAKRGIALLRADANAGFTHKKTTDPFLCGLERRVRVAEVRGIPEADASLVGHFNGDPEIVEDRSGASLSFHFRSLAEVRWIEIEDVVVLDPRL